MNACVHVYINRPDALSWEEWSGMIWRQRQKQQSGLGTWDFTAKGDTSLRSPTPQTLGKRQAMNAPCAASASIVLPSGVIRTEVIRPSEP